MLPRSLAIALFAVAVTSLRAQQASTTALPAVPEATNLSAERPASAWLDLRQNSGAKSKTQAAPAWIESVNLVPAQNGPAGEAHTVLRIRIQRPGPEYNAMFFRLFFDDKADARPELVAWDESGTQVLRSGQLGSGLDLPSSDSVIVPLTSASTIDIEVPGDGKTIRGAYLDWMTSSEVLHPLAAEHRDVIPEPFGSTSPLHAPAQDTERFGTVTATLSNETIRIGSGADQAAVFEFGIESDPLLVLLTFEVASPRVDTPPEIYVNGVDVGPVSIGLPELADPAFRGEMESLVREMHFQYTGWLRAQKIVPASSLHAGSNSIMILSGAGSPASAIRATQVQLKYLWDKSDYLLKP